MTLSPQEVRLPPTEWVFHVTVEHTRPIPVRVATATCPLHPEAALRRSCRVTDYSNDDLLAQLAVCLPLTCWVCRTDAIATAEPRLATTPILAYKLATLGWKDDDPCFVPLRKQAYKYGVEATAICPGYERVVSRRPVTLTTGDDPCPTIPNLRHTCGFYAMAEPFPVRPGSVRLEVELSGRVIVCSGGYRAERQRVVKVSIPASMWGSGTETWVWAIQARHPDLPITHPHP